MAPAAGRCTCCRGQNLYSRSPEMLPPSVDNARLLSPDGFREQEVLYILQGSKLQTVFTWHLYRMVAYISLQLRPFLPNSEEIALDVPLCAMRSCPKWVSDVQ